MTRALRRFWLVALLLFGAVVALGGAAAFLPKDRYRATSTLLVQPSGQNNDPQSYASIDVVRFLIPSVAQEVSTETFYDRVRARAGEPVASGAFTLSGSFDPGTPLIKVSAESTDPQIAGKAAVAADNELTIRPISQLITITSVDPARTPSSPSGPLRIPILVGSMVLGAILALFGVLAISSVRRRITSADELRQRFGLEVLGEIPKTRRFPSTAGELFNGPATDPRLVEAYHRLRTNVEIILVSQPARTVAVTSFGAGEGKSSVASSLAWAIAALGQEVVAVDGDLRRPALHDHLDRDLDRGVTDIATGADIEPLLKSTGLPTLLLLPAGRLDRHPTQAISAAFPRLLDALEGKHRVVVVDSPPMAVAESTLIAVLTKLVIIVVDARSRDPEDIQRALTELSQAGVNVIGAVLNRVPRSRVRRSSDYYYYHQPESRRRRRGRSRPTEAEQDVPRKTA